MLSDHDRQLLLSIARQSLASHLSREETPRDSSADVLMRPSGAFVTLHHRGELRGCIGHIEANEPLGVVVARCAVAAGTSDPRFAAVLPSELRDIEIELSILGPLEPVSDIREIEVGKHGLVIEHGWHRGLLLPQVAIEWKWDRDTFVAETCRKAGLPRDAWKTGAKIWKFEAEVFGENGQ